VPLFSEMDQEAQERMLQKYDQRILALMEGKAKLRERRRAVILSNAEDLQIEAGLLRLQAAADDLLDEKAALKLSTKSISAPSDEDLSEMRDAVAAIHNLNAKSKQASAIIAAVVEVAGNLPKPPR
jgi:IS4 transposase